MFKIKVLGIAPYETMKQKMEELVEKFPQIELDVYVGDLKNGVDIVLQNISNNYDVIISRGGTAQMIEKITSIPIIEITLSVYDILRAIKLAENISDKYAIVGFSNITSTAHLLCNLLHYKIEIVTITNEAEAEKTLLTLKGNGYTMILCDMIANTIAKRIGLNSILFISGNESIENAFAQSVKLCTNYTDIKEKNVLLQNIIEGTGIQTVVFDDCENLQFTAGSEVTQEMIQMLRAELPRALGENTLKAFRHTGNTLYSVQNRVVRSTKRTYIIFYVSPAGIPASVSKYGIRFSDQKEVEQELYNNFYSSSIPDLKKQIEKIGSTDFPVMIYGEKGTETEQTAQALYLHSRLCCNPFVTINCRLINDKHWNYLTNHYNSPLTDNNNTIFFKDVDQLSGSRVKQLQSLILDMNLCRRNRIIFSCTKPRQSALPQIVSDFIHLFSCLTVSLPPLREVIKDLPNFSSLYLGNLNVELANQIIGFEPEAMSLLQEYDWPENIQQLKLVLNELAVITSGPYIDADSVQKKLEKEKAYSAEYCPAVSFLADSGSDKTLEEITCSIIKQIFCKNNKNQSLTAKQLGISRSTLWRYLKKTEDI